MRINRLKALFASAAVVAFGAALAPAAQAQDTAAPVQKPFRIKIGSQFLLDDLGENTFHIGASYDFGKTTAEKPTVYGLYVDGFFDDVANTFGVGGMMRYYFTPILATTRYYAGAGIGAYIADPDGGDTKTRFGGKLFVGGEFNQGLFGEVDVTFPGEDNNGLGVAIGYRF